MSNTVDNHQRYAALREKLQAHSDISTILDLLLQEARNVTQADAGTIYLVENEGLRFSYVHNDTLFTDSINKHVYTDVTLPIDENSIVGYVASHGKTLALKDVYHLPSELPFCFNKSFDVATGYTTGSMLTVPILDFSGKVTGVIQLINSKNEVGKIVPFSPRGVDFVEILARHSASAIERGMLTRELILRMLKMAELRDPHETQSHVERVGAYCAEIFHQWALDNDIEPAEIQRRKDLIRIAGMLHDVGKVGISDTILKKPGKLTDDEFEQIKHHTIFGARLFPNARTELDQMSRDIALRHHEKWNGNGYPGPVDDVNADINLTGEGLPPSEVPIEARIAAVADVFDALSSRRCYKPEFTDEKCISIIKSDSGTHFDPSVVDAFLKIFDVIKAIRERYK
ncbi:MAG: HD domain-containing phosphohydrolase [Desulfovibrio sp.]